jgi:hypothetical protein
MQKNKLWYTVSTQKTIVQHTPSRDISQNMKVWFGADKTVTLLPINQARGVRLIFLR